MEQQWTEIQIETTSAGIDPVGMLLLELGFGGYAVQDAADFEEFLEGKSGQWDYIDEDLMRLRDAPTILTAYLADNGQGADRLALLQENLTQLRARYTDIDLGTLAVSLSILNEQDWANAWKQYYKPVKTGRRLVVCPSWEEYAPRPDEVILRLDPGMAFGTGTHETTRLCLGMLDVYDPAGKTVLDVGCGSGILSVAAMLLGAESALGIDIDQNAVKVAKENAALNGVCAEYRRGDLAGGVAGAYDIIFANIVADAIRSLVPDIPARLTEGGVFIASGIIDTRAGEVLAAIEAAGLTIIRREDEGGWVCVAAMAVDN